ncbi:MAG TPA: 30S ribosomal protein S6 [Bacteroidetes bacterium]|nr:30S ribosomal protein S6 [Bacteroidota bacterium]
MLRPYETTFVIDSLLRMDEIDETIRRYLRFISANGGQIRRLERWGKRRLAYEIRKRQYGYYVYVRYDAPPTIVQALEQEFRLDESILRYLTIQLTKRALQKEQRLIAQGLIKEGGVEIEEKAPAETKSAEKPAEEAKPATAETAAEPASEAGEAETRAEPAEAEPEASGETAQAQEETSTPAEGETGEKEQS